MIYRIADKEVEKRYIISKERLAELCKPDHVYVVRCMIDKYYRGDPTVFYQRGFFSLFIQAVQGLYFSEQFGIPCYIDFGHVPMLYSDPDKFGGDTNFWNYYFEQPFFKALDPGQPVIINSFYETYPLRIWDARFFRSSGDVVKKYIKYRKPVQENMEIIKKEFIQNRVLGVQIRKTDHAEEVSGLRMDRFIREIENNLPNFDKVFVATDAQMVVEQLIREFGKEKILVNAATRSADEEPVHLNFNLKDRYALGLEALLDGYCLSLCQKAILMHSNISYSSLLFNPDLPYILMENADTKIKRLKTQLLYKLHIYGIRGM